MAKSPDAFRTISEVADWLGIQAHVLRFWESKFSQVKPIKRAGGRRYYRPADMLLLGGIKKLLHDDGMTIKGVQKMLREEGMSHVAALSEPLDELTMSELDKDDAHEATAIQKPAPQPTPEPPAAPEKGVVLEFAAPEERPTAEVKDAPQASEKDMGSEDHADDTPPDFSPIEETGASPLPQDQPAAEEVAQPDMPIGGLPSRDTDAPSKDAATPPAEASAPSEPAPQSAAPETTPEEPSADSAAKADRAQPEETEPDPSTDASEDEPAAALPAFLRKPLEDVHDTPTDANPAPAPKEALPEPETASEPTPEPESEPEPMSEAEPEPVAASTSEPEPAPEPTPPPGTKPRIVEVTFPPLEAEINATPGALNAAYRARALSPAQIEGLRPLLRQLTALRDSMSARRQPTRPTPSKN